MIENEKIAYGVESVTNGGRYLQIINTSSSAGLIKLERN